MAITLKPSADDLEEILKETIDHSWSAGILTRKKAREDYSLYEIFVFTLILEAARELGASKIEYKEWNGTTSTTTTRPNFMTGPHSLSTDGDVFAEFKLPYRRKSIEVHLGVYVQGKSGVAHECDVSILKSSKASRCRKTKTNPIYHDLLLAVECKYYAQPIGVSMARDFIGLSRDLTVPRKNNFIAVNPPLGADGQTLLDRHNVCEHSQLVPKLRKHRTAQINELINQIKKILNDYR